ncbi:unnamed protein product [Pleuronectes platessa]|uniref:Uncharacterized protein n=1 Tax=Pleuronectes platessa TaxID=8262 RepID=A0A9N7TM29_PLEPL|nr:unnamed protein product [Pleuronectes platessa]
MAGGKGRRLNRPCAGWLVSLTIEVAFRVRRVVAATAPHSDAAGQDAFNGAPVECFQDGFTAELRALQASGCQLERLYKRSGLTVHLETFRDHLRSYKEVL